MWKIFKGLPRALRQQYNGPARSSPVGSISAEEEEGSRLNCSIKNSTLIYKQPASYFWPDGLVETPNKDSPGGDQEWQHTFRNYCHFGKKTYLLESLSLGTAIALGVNLINYHQLLAVKDGRNEFDNYNHGRLSCLLRVAFSMPKSTRHVLPQQQEEAKGDDNVDQQKAVARKAFEEACDSFMSLVNMYTGLSRTVSGVQKSSKGLHEDAVRDWQEASSLGNSKADYNLGICYELGRGAPKCLTRAAQHYKMAALAGHSKAQYNLAMLIVSGRCQLSDNPFSALQLLELAASQGLAEAQTYLGVLYASDIKDYTKAVPMLEAAAEHKDTNALYQLAICYEQGLGVEPNKKKAAELFSQAAQAGHAKAQYNLAVFHENGWGGLPVNIQTAKRLYAKSAAKGLTNAKYNLRRLEAMEAVNELNLREKTSFAKMADNHKKSTIHVSSSSPNLVLMSKGDKNQNITKECREDEHSRKPTSNFNVGGQSVFGNLFDLNFGNFGTGHFGSFSCPQRELAVSTCSVGEAEMHQNKLDNCFA